jgi:hypothetical protein
MTRIVPEIVSVSPTPTPEVLKAIEQALAEAWPQPAPKAVAEVPAWRFSGRWWAQPAALRRDRPIASI